MVSDSGGEDGSEGGGGGAVEGGRGGSGAGGQGGHQPSTQVPGLARLLASSLFNTPNSSSLTQQFCIENKLLSNALWLKSPLVKFLF